VAKRTNEVAKRVPPDHLQGIAEAARNQAIAKSWGRPMRAAAQGKTSASEVKLHPGWDAAFKRARAV
jgi:hypothetical protein